MDWEVLAHGYGLAEAPTIDVDGSIVFSDVLRGGVYRLRSNGEIATVVPKRRGVGGIAIHADGGIVCTGRDVVHVRADGTTTTVLHVDGVAGWNDVCTDATGRLYAGALRFAVFDPGADVIAGELWRADTNGAEVVVDDVVHANGVACATDGSAVYVSDTRRQQIVVFDFERAARRVIDVSAYGHPDGIALDELGGLWVALVGGGIGRFTPDGRLDRNLTPPSAFTTSLCFQGDDLLVTTGGSSTDPALGGCVLRTSVGVTGAPVYPARI